uniref:Retrovirus-related Pol polyprotein from transposon 412 n=1 Tax=Schistocephalus solidus TaxID=70667 RepID=A0A0X3PTE0_SCHSO
MSTLQEKFTTVFQDGFDCCTKMKVILRLQRNAKPVLRPKRPAPYTALTVVDQELERLQQVGVLHRGLFQFTRLSFGVRTAPAIFQQTMDNILTGTEGATAHLDDILVTGSNPDEVLQCLVTVLSRLQDYGFRLHLDKCNFFHAFCVIPRFQNRPRRFSPRPG